MPRPADESIQGARRQAWLRAGAGLSLILLLLALLAFVERQLAPAQKPEIEAAPPAVAANAISAEPPAPAASEPLIGEVVALPAETQALAPADGAGEPPAAPESSAAPEIAPPGARQADAPAPTLPAPTPGGEPRLVLRSLPEEPDAASAAEPPASMAKAAKPPTAKGFLLQLGVFGDSSNAQALYDELRRQGLPARLETRVVAGPFSSRESAAAARDRLARAGMARGLVVPER